MENMRWEPGTVTPETVYWFRCAHCLNEWHDGGNGLHWAEKEARRIGWSKTVKHGWVCPECADAAEEE